MIENSWGIASVWMGLALLASFISIRFKLSVALVEILIGIAAGNLAVPLDLHHAFGLHWHLESKMSTGLTFGTISDLFGLTHGYIVPGGGFHSCINQEQYSVLVTVVIGKADLTAIGVAEVPEVVGMIDEVDELRESAGKHFQGLGEASVEFARSRGIALRSVVVRGHAADAIVRYAENEEMNLVVLGHHGHSRIARFFLGSTTDRVSEHCPCSVVIVK